MLDLRSNKDEECGKDGEIRMLRESLKRAQEERLEHIQNVHTQKSEKEKSLRTDNDRLNTQLQFREREYQELQVKCRQMEQRLHHIMDPGGDHASLPASPVSRKVVASHRSPQSTFPTARTFLSSEKGEPSSGLMSDAETMTTTLSEICGTSKRRGTLSLDVRHSQGHITGPQLVSKLIHSDHGLTKEMDDESIIGLLQTPSTSLDLQSFMFERDCSTLRLSPVRSRRISDVKMSLQHAERSESKRIVPPHFHIMAMKGLQHLLSQASVNSSVTPAPDSVSVDSAASSTGSLNGPVLILPLLNCYLSHYIVLLNKSTTENVVTSPSSSTGSLRTYSSESPSSLESLTSSLSQLLMDGQRCANTLESYCLASLTTLCKLVSFSSAVRLFMLTGTSGLCRSNEAKPSHKESVDKGQGVSMETDFSSVSSGESLFSCGSSVFADQLEEINLLDKVLRLANPGQGQETCTCNPHVVEGALNVMSALASPKLEPHCDRLKLVVTQGVISNCLDCEVFPSIILAGVKLVCRLCHCPIIASSLCTTSDNCPLLTMYLLSIKSFEQADAVIKISIYKEVIMCICNIVSSQGGGLGILLDTDCQCSVEVIRSVITMLCSVLDQYQCCSCDDDLSLLCRGLMLLHRISQHDGQFTDKHQEVQHAYVHLICGLTSLLKHNTKLYDNELSALADLWDFPQDDYELNQDSEEDGMETDAGS
ncbi:ATR-interacting protein-like isoform X2 [Gigantopelta aegis]|uniref:ATR-interacting protein-like isoform X2 n=1 Tax=Gigantopelta aegis TaxID=1735272 RepID=UPI001B88B3CE|nr:ATR-interacting protein-like isoform X2 [Gigantopelta aegis]